MTKLPRNLPRLEAIFASGFEYRTSPGYKDNRVSLADGWHLEPAPCPDGVVRHHWHASALAGCPRAQVLKRAQMPSDGKPLNSEITLAFGHTVHAMLEEFTSATIDDVPVPNLIWPGRVQHLGAETGGCLHPGSDVSLKARADWTLIVDDVVAIQDLKTEGTHLYRVDAAKAEGAKDFAKQEHKIQIACNAIIQEGMGLVPDRVKYGAVTYCSKISGKDRQGRAYSKNEWKWDTQWFEITEEMRETVYEKIENLNNAWQQFESEGDLPARMPDQFNFGRKTLHFLCLPRSADDGRGKFCDVRSTCFSLENVGDSKEA